MNYNYENKLENEVSGKGGMSKKKVEIVENIVVDEEDINYVKFVMIKLEK